MDNTGNQPPPPAPIDPLQAGAEAFARTQAQIRHTPPGIKPGGAPAGKRPTGENKIRAFEQKLGQARGDAAWKRKPSVHGTGACHVKTFHAKLTGDALAYLDQQINEWLDEHDEVEVKLVTTTIGEWAGKLGTEPHMICQVWV